MGMGDDDFKYAKLLSISRDLRASEPFIRLISRNCRHMMRHGGIYLKCISSGHP